MNEQQFTGIELHKHSKIHNNNAIIVCDMQTATADHLKMTYMFLHSLHINMGIFIGHLVIWSVHISIRLSIYK